MIPTQTGNSYMEPVRPVKHFLPGGHPMLAQFSQKMKAANKKDISGPDGNSPSSFKRKQPIIRLKRK